MKILGNGAALVIAALMLVSCHKAETVQAGNDAAPAADAIVRPQVNGQSQGEIDGLLRGVDVPGKYFVMRVENGMDQTFKCNDETEVTGVTPPSVRSEKDSQPSALMKELAA